MTKKQVLFRLEDSLELSFDNKLKEKGISKQFFFVKCVELFIEGKLSLEDSSQLSSDSSIDELKKQIAIILERLDKLEGDSKVIAFDKTIDIKEVDNIDSIQLSNDSSQELSPNVDNTAESTLSELPTMPIKEVEGQTIPLAENKPENEDNSENIDAMVSLLDDKEETKIGTLKEALDNVILPELAKGTDKKDIAKMLQGKYIASATGESTNWQVSVVTRAIKSRKEGKV